MALTKKKRTYAEARERGACITDAAKLADCPEKTARQAGSRMEKDGDVIRYRERIRSNKSTPDIELVENNTDVGAEENKSEQIASGRTDDPIEFLTRQMNDVSEDPKLRQDAAKALLPYKHPRLGERGKKEDKQDKAKQTASKSKFKPRLVK